ncbi:MAG: ATP-binding cassette domain-containing protein [Helicobacteraceae bacterium]|nr:ATP-binding cassette domain-containing protein [Helicobacteraceae bacterium]
MIELKDVCCAYEKSILENVTFKTSKHLTVMGANGSGKSTLAKSIASLLEYKGEMLFNDIPLVSLSLQSRAKTINYVPASLQSYDQFLNIKEYLLMGRYPYKSALQDYSEADYKIVEEIIKYFDFESSKYLNSLSSGQSQLLLIAQALTQNAKLTIFDEPTANLDPKNSKIFLHELKKMMKKTQTILITHDINLAYQLEGNILFIKEKEALFFENKHDFFNTKTLKELYDVEFSISEKGVLASYE